MLTAPQTEDKDMTTYTLRNEFHNTECNVRCEGLSHIHNVVEIQLTKSQTKRVRRALCGIDGCTCAEHECGIRGRQYTDEGKRIVVAVFAVA